MGKVRETTQEADAFAARVWFAFHCLKREAPDFERPSFRELELKYHLPLACISKIFREKRSHHDYDTVRNLARALEVDEQWLKYGGPTGPTPSEPIPPFPGKPWAVYGEIAGWDEAVAVVLADSRQKVPPAAFLAGADCPVVRPVATVTPALAIGVSLFAYEMISPREQARYDAAQAKASGSAGMSGKMKAARRR